MPFLHALTDYRQIAEEDVEKPRTYGNYSKMRKFENPRWRPAAILDLQKC